MRNGSSGADDAQLQSISEIAVNALYFGHELSRFANATDGRIGDTADALSVLIIDWAKRLETEESA